MFSQLDDVGLLNFSIIKVLSIRNANMDGVDARYLEWLPTMDWLSLSNNFVTRLTAGLFKANPKLKIIDFGSNFITVRVSWWTVLAC